MAPPLRCKPENHVSRYDEKDIRAALRSPAVFRRASGDRAGDDDRAGTVAATGEAISERPFSRYACHGDPHRPRVVEKRLVRRDPRERGRRDVRPQRRLDWCYSAFPSTVLPLRISEYLDSRFPDRKVVSIGRGKESYRVEFADGRRVDFDMKGELTAVER